MLKMQPCAKCTQPQSLGCQDAAEMFTGIQLHREKKLIIEL